MWLEPGMRGCLGGLVVRTYSKIIDKISTGKSGTEAGFGLASLMRKASFESDMVNVGESDWYAASRR